MEATSCCTPPLNLDTLLPTTSQSALACCLARLLEAGRWPVLRQLLPWEWACLAGTAVSVNWLSNLTQQVRSRKSNWLYGRCLGAGLREQHRK